ncbi:unnamed protein product [Timema podura]|uniref:Uncharacterized protein n=1 Tax=Timema podura TaxID=61482 RepID=A0ABN7NU01_TIMPD|nr:unnamed protein product [Timema podura]
MGWRCMCVVFTILSTSLGNARSENFIDEVEPNSEVKEGVKEGFGNQINLCRDQGLNPGPLSTEV